MACRIIQKIWFRLEYGDRIMICCKCKKPIERSYGRVTDLGNYCRECAKQNEIEAEKTIGEVISKEFENVYKQGCKDTAKKIYHLVEMLPIPRSVSNRYGTGFENALTVVKLEIAKQFGVEIDNTK